MRAVNVADFKTGPFPRKSSGAQGGNPSFVFKLRQGVHLIHKLRELRRREKFFYNRGYRAEIYKLGGREAVSFFRRHPVLHNPFESRESDPQAPLEQFSDSLKPPVAKVVDVIRLSFRLIVERDYFPYNRNQIFG